MWIIPSATIRIWDLFSMTISFPNETWTSRSRVETAKRKKRPVFADIRSIKAKTKVFSGNLLAPRGMLAVTCYTRSSVFQSFFVKLNHSIQISTLIETQTIFSPRSFYHHVPCIDKFTKRSTKLDWPHKPNVAQFSAGFRGAEAVSLWIAFVYSCSAAFAGFRGAEALSLWIALYIAAAQFLLASEEPRHWACESLFFYSCSAVFAGFRGAKTVEPVNCFVYSCRAVFAGFRGAEAVEPVICFVYSCSTVLLALKELR